MVRFGGFCERAGEFLGAIHGAKEGMTLPETRETHGW